MKTLVLLDSHALLHRAYHALPNFTSKTGEPTGALYGFSSMVLRVIKELKPDYLVAAFDLPGKTFRHEAYKEYKGKRPKAEDALISQLKRSHDVVRAFGIPEMSCPGFEADDVLGTIVEKMKKKKDLRIIIVSGDADTFQLVDGERVVVYTMRKGLEDTVIYDEKKVLERFGFPPTLLSDYKGLRGDTSDNIVGVPGIGEKTGSDVIQKFGALESVYKNLKKGDSKDLKERIVKLLLDHEEDALFSKVLATIRRDAPITFALPKKNYEIDTKNLKSIFIELGFNSLVKRVFGETETPEKKLETAKMDFGDESASFALVQSGEIFGTVDFEKKVVSNDVKGLIKISKKVPTVFFDVTIANWACQSTKKDLGLSEDPKEALEALPALYQTLRSLVKEKNVEKVLHEIEFPLIPILAEMEQSGIGIDKKFLRSFKKEVEKKIAGLEKQIFALAGTNFNLNSPLQVAEVLDRMIGMPGKKTKTGRISTREKELAKLQEKSPIVPLILSYREHAKILSTYSAPLLEIAETSDRVHTTFNQTGTVTGRLSSDSPNLQNIPIRSELGARIRDAFVASPGYTLAAFDYAQIELKILAAFAKDEAMIRAFKEGADIHRVTAAYINNVPAEKVTKEMRMFAKAINFGIIFGMGVRQLAENTGRSVPEAREFYEEYFRDFPRIRAYMNDIHREAKKRGYVETLFGRKRFFDLGAISGNRFLESEMDRMALNAVIQGTDADIVKYAMVNIRTLFDPEEVRLLLQIHDELIYEIRDDIVKSTIPRMRRAMEEVVDIGVPLSVEVRTGARWGSLVSYPTSH